MLTAANYRLIRKYIGRYSVEERIDEFGGLFVVFFPAFPGATN